MTDLFENPMGLEGFEFVEFAAPETNVLEPVFEKKTNRSFTDRGVRVAVVCYADNELKYQYDSIDHLLAVGVATRLKLNHVET